MRPLESVVDETPAMDKEAAMSADSVDAVLREIPAEPTRPDPVPEEPAVTRPKDPEVPPAPAKHTEEVPSDSLSSVKRSLKKRNTGVVGLKAKLGSNLSNTEQMLLDQLDEWDVDGDGHFSAEEVFTAAKFFLAEQQKVKNLKKIIAIGLVVFMVMVGVLIGISIAGNELAKDSRPTATGIQTTTDGLPVANAVAKKMVPLPDYPSLADSQLRTVEDVVFMHKAKFYMFKVTGMVRHTPDTIDLFLLPNGLATKVSVAKGVTSLTLADGTTEKVDFGETIAHGRRLAKGGSRDCTKKKCKADTLLTSGSFTIVATEEPEEEVSAYVPDEVEEVEIPVDWAPVSGGTSTDPNFVVTREPLEPEQITLADVTDLQESLACSPAPCEASTTDAFTESGGYVILPAPGAGLQILESNSSTVNSMWSTLVRSYDSRAWELAVDSADWQLANCGDACVRFPAGYSLRFRSITVADVATKALTARFLRQATFGPTKASVDSFVSGEAWVAEQMALPHSSLREYYRRYANPKIIGTYTAAGDARPKCEAGSRWRQYTLVGADEGASLTTKDGKLYVDGVYRTESPSPALPDAFICDVEESVGGAVTLGTLWTTSETGSGSCTKAGKTQGHVNPPVVQPELADAPDEFAELSSGPDLVLLKTPSAGCSLGDAAKTGGKAYLYEPRLVLEENTFEKPNVGGSAGAERCSTVPKTFLNEASCVPSPTCGGPKWGSSKFALTPNNLELFYSHGNKLVYEVVGLVDTASPCKRLSRWEQLDCSVDDCTATITGSDAEAVQTAIAGVTGWLRDVEPACSSAAAHGVVELFGDFFKHVHGDEHNVYDFSTWVYSHPGGKRHIKKWTGSGFKVEFPAHRDDHPMSRWTTGLLKLDFVGVAQAEVDFADLPTELQTRDLAEAFGSKDMAEGTAFESCGSPGEVANDPTKGHMAKFCMAADCLQDQSVDAGVVESKGIERTDAWATVATEAPDQLRQRMAWALSQILVVGINGFKAPPGNMQEFQLTFHDIFVRNAFGNFFDILKQVTYSPVMGEYLTYRTNLARDVDGKYPDENYAREVMQLFTIGLLELREDGTVVRDSAGLPVATYDNENIMNFARVFTGMNLQAGRANIETLGGNNFIDPMTVKPAQHDWYPKMGLTGYIGDGAPICKGLSGQFLQAGAEFRYLGEVEQSGALALDASGGLFQALCGKSAAPCEFAPSVTLPSTLACTGDECKVDQVLLVQVSTGYFEYVAPPCVRLFFAEGGSTAEATNGGIALGETCADPTAFVAGTSCCKKSTKERVCLYSGEYVSYSTAVARCSEAGLEICGKDTASSGCSFERVWTDGGCSLKVEVDSEGRVAHESDTLNMFTVEWLAGFPTSPCPTGCAASTTGCLCSASVVTEQVFDHVPATTGLAQLTVGGTVTGDCKECGEVQAWYGAEGIDQNTVFGYQGKYYQNIRSTVVVGTSMFRNPPLFNGGDGGERGAMAEVNALLDHLFNHPNTPAFVAYRLIQRFTSSNPSPAYVKAVADAFRTGTYDGKTHSGKYGCMAATVSAILLHSEARSASLEEDPSYGKLQEPWVKVIHVLRALEYKPDRMGVFSSLEDTIGQNFFKSPSVFNFYRPDFQPMDFPPDYFAPEFEILTAPWLVGFLNGVLSVLTSPGVTSCDEGFSSEKMCSANGALGFSGTADDLDLLLTGGRLSKDELAEVTSALSAGGIADANSLIFATPAFHTLGGPQPLRERPAVPTTPAKTPTSYKATVMFFMSGGADTFNMLVPVGCPLEDEYKTVRTDAALATDGLMPVSSGSSQSCDTFAFHKKFAFVRELYERKQAAVVSNIGNLPQPITKATLKTSPQCVGMYSHIDQRIGAATLQCQTLGTTPKGAGGRLVDALGDFATSSFSTSGTTTWTQGYSNIASIVSPQKGVVLLKQTDALRTFIDNVTKLEHRNLYADEFVRSLGSSLGESEELGAILDAAQLSSTAYSSSDSTKTSSAMQLYQVARLIAAREVRGAERDVFYVELTGFDAHNDLHDTMEEKFEEMDNALRDFVTELEAQNVFDDVVIATSSDFGRTLTSNGAGTDHAWAGQQLLLGGKVNGGQILNKFPTSLLEGNEQDAGRGRLIPQYPLENMFVPLAKWMGVADASLSSVFPNYGNFNSTHILSESDVFLA